METIEFGAMGCRVLAALDTSGEAARHTLSAVPAWFEEWERHLSRFRADSELSRLNLKAGRAVRVSAVLWSALQAALTAARHTQGLVTPTMLEALEVAGYDRTFEDVVLRISVGTEPASRNVISYPDAWQRINCVSDKRSVRLPPGVKLDLGGSAKGWAANLTAQRLAVLSGAPALVDAGGDVAASGPQADGSPWPVAVADPTAPEQDLELLRLGLGAYGVATSGRDYRRWRQGGVWQHHILDPRTGGPVDTDVLSATVIAPTVLEAEAAAKASLILGSRNGLAWLEARPEMAGLLVLECGQVVRSSRLPCYVWS